MAEVESINTNQPTSTTTPATIFFLLPLQDAYAGRAFSFISNRGYAPFSPNDDNDENDDDDDHHLLREVDLTILNQRTTKKTTITMIAKRAIPTIQYSISRYMS